MRAQIDMRRRELGRAFELDDVLEDTVGIEEQRAKRQLEEMARRRIDTEVAGMRALDRIVVDELDDEARLALLGLQRLRRRRELLLAEHLQIEDRARCAVDQDYRFSCHCSSAFRA
jgi:hypothetical protein